MVSDPSSELRVISSMIERAQKFILPDNADLIDLAQTDDGFGGLLKLPYDEVVLEYVWTSDNECIEEAYKQFSTPRRIVLAWNANSSGGQELARLASKKLGLAIGLVDGIYLLSIYQTKAAPDWQIGCKAALIHLTKSESNQEKGRYTTTTSSILEAELHLDQHIKSQAVPAQRSDLICAGGI